MGTSSQVQPGVVTFVHPTVLNGTLGVEINSADNGNHWAEVTVRGGVGEIPGASVNRNGIGANVFFTPEGGKTSIRPIFCGSSYASQDALAANFGLGQEAGGDVEVMWPGGVRNKLFGVAHGKRITFPEIPCSYDGEWANQGQYVQCVTRALNAAGQAGLYDPANKDRFLESAILAYQQAQ